MPLDAQGLLDALVDAFLAQLRGAGGASARRDRPRGHALVLGDAEGLRRLFDGYLDSPKGHGVTDHVHVVTSTAPIEPRLANCLHDTHLLRIGQRVVEPFASTVTVRPEGERWRAVSIATAVMHDEWRFRVPGAAAPGRG